MTDLAELFWKSMQLSHCNRFWCRNSSHVVLASYAKRPSQTRYFSFCVYVGVAYSRVVSSLVCSQGWAWTLDPPAFASCVCALVLPMFMWYWESITLGALYMLGKHCINYAIFPALNLSTWSKYHVLLEAVHFHCWGLTDGQGLSLATAGSSYIHSHLKASRELMTWLSSPWHVFDLWGCVSSSRIKRSIILAHPGTILCDSKNHKNINPTFAKNIQRFCCIKKLACHWLG